MLQTNRLNLRNFRLSDLESTHIYASNPVVVQFQRWGPNQVISETKSFLEEAIQSASNPDQTDYEFAIELKEGTIHIGGCGIYLDPDGQPIAHLGYILNPKYWGKGYATEASKALIQFAFQMGIQKVEATCDTRNIASKRVLEKCGMQLASTFQEENLQKGAIRWSHLYYIESEDYEAR